MHLTKTQEKKVVSTALSFLNKPYQEGFRCVDFVRQVYREVGIEIPKLKPISPPSDFNISKEQLCNPPAGHIIFLRDRNDPRKFRAWTHIGITLENAFCIHNSLFLGEKVTISPIQELLKSRYDFAESL